MSFIVFGNLQSSVPPVLDTTPCMHQMLQYEDCVMDSNIKQLEVLHPSWPSVWPRMLTDGKIVDLGKTPITPAGPDTYIFLRPLTKKKKQYLWECEEERFVFKACLREIIKLKRTDRHTSWDTAPVSNITLT